MRRQHKTIVLWAVLVLMFVMVYSMFAEDERHGGSENSWLFFPFIGLVGAVATFVVVRHVREGKRFLREQHDALSALHRGELAKAREMFSSWAESDLRRVAALSRHNLAWTLMRQGDLKYAVVMAHNAMERYSRELRVMQMLPTTMVDLALFHALVGDIEAAKRVMSDLEQRKDLIGTAGLPSMKTFTNAVIACRDGRTGEAAKLLEENWASCESVLTGDVLRPLRVIRAFSIASGDARDVAKADLQLVNSRPAFSGEYDFLGKAWPEMQAFLVTHELATASDSPT